MPIYEVRDDLLPFRKDGTESFSMLPVGTIFASAVPQIDARVHLLDGSTISQTGIYKTFANLIKSLVAAGHNITYSSDTEFYSDVATYGQCGKFVIDDVNGTIRLPLITEFIASNNGGKEIGLAQLDEFKSHQHAFSINAMNDSWSCAGGGYYVPKGGGVWHYNTDYKGGSETRPKNVRYPYYIVLAAGYKSDQVVDIDNIVTELDGKQDKLTAQSVSLNTTRIGQNDTVIEYFVSSDATTWYRKWASGWKECGGCFMSADTSSGVYLAFPITFEQSVHAIQFTDTESVWNAHGCIPKALYWPGNTPENYDGKAGMRVLTPALNTGTTYAKHRISYYAQGY